MEIVVRGRNVEVPDHFRAHVADKLSRIERYDTKIVRVDVELLHERNPRQSDVCQRVEITCRVRGPVVRAEACAGDFYAALEKATEKIERRFRQAADRRRIHHGRRSPTSVAQATSGVGAPTVAGAALAVLDRSDALPDGSSVDADADADADADGHLPGRVVREKVHPGTPTTIDQALLEMELVGHDFFLFVDKESEKPSVVYRRRGYDYGVISLDVD